MASAALWRAPEQGLCCSLAPALGCLAGCCLGLLEPSLLVYLQSCKWQDGPHPGTTETREMTTSAPLLVGALQGVTRSVLRAPEGLDPRPLLGSGLTLRTPLGFPSGTSQSLPHCPPLGSAQEAQPSTGSTGPGDSTGVVRARGGDCVRLGAPWPEATLQHLGQHWSAAPRDALAGLVFGAALPPSSVPTPESCWHYGGCGVRVTWASLGRC